MQEHNDVQEKPLILLDLWYKTSEMMKSPALEPILINKITSASWSWCESKRD